MKRLLSILLALCITAVAFAQTVREEIDANPHLAIPTHAVYAGKLFSEPIAKAPKGYKPFYISHYGRHGSRFEANVKYTTELVAYFKYAEEQGLLTEKGKALKNIFEKIHNIQEPRIGELTTLGAEQHKGIARRMYQRFKPVFHPGSIINSRSSTYTRCILSMAAFNESLKECKPMVETRMVASERDQKMIRPLQDLASQYDYKYRYQLDHEWKHILNEWAAKQDLSHATNKLFTNIDPICAHFGRTKIYIMSSIYKRLAFMQNFGLNDRSVLDDIFTAEERLIMYKHESYVLYCNYSGTTLPDANKYFATMHLLIDDFVKYADLAIEGKNSAVADLRFGHDYFLLGILSMANFNEVRMDYDYKDVDKLTEQWRAYKFITMASNIQFVFYRGKKGDDVLVRILHNENDMTLPIESETAPFYKWEDVKSYLTSRTNSFRN